MVPKQDLIVCFRCGAFPSTLYPSDHNQRQTGDPRMHFAVKEGFRNPVSCHTWTFQAALPCRSTSLRIIPECFADLFTSVYPSLCATSLSSSPARKFSYSQQNRMYRTWFLGSKNRAVLFPHAVLFWSMWYWQTISALCCSYLWLRGNLSRYSRISRVAWHRVRIAGVLILKPWVVGKSASELVTPDTCANLWRSRLRSRCSGVLALKYLYM